MNYRLILYIALALALALVSLAACRSEQTADGGDAKLQTVTVQELKSITDKDTSTLLIDVRTPDEYRAVHAKPVKELIVHTDIAKSEALLPADKTKPIYLICRSGRRSGIAGKELLKLGYENVFNVAGGTSEWVKEGLPTDSGQGILTPPAGP